MKLPHEAEFASAKLCCIVLGKAPQVNLGEVYVTFRSTIKRSEDVQ